MKEVTKVSDVIIMKASIQLPFLLMKMVTDLPGCMLYTENNPWKQRKY